MPGSFTCVIIGAGTLPIQCAELLLRREVSILGIISPDADVRRWAAERVIPSLESVGDLSAFLRRQPFDYLFSIVNAALLPRAVLALPKRLAINYHDAPLPRYAGMHATSWAIMHREQRHGVTWHVMTERVDAGDILKQQSFAIAANETALTLNLKCYDAAIRSFAELVDDLVSERVAPRKQDLAQHRVTILNLPTAYWHAWVAELERVPVALPAALRLVVVGTEPALTERYSAWQRLAGERIRWVNAYGPTETTVTATTYNPDSAAHDLSTFHSVPIGRPIDNVQTYVLDRQCNPVPIGVPGELYIGGVGMARGYLNRPDLTAERFITVHLPIADSGLGQTDQNPVRLYKTGDLTRYLPDGTLEFLGRTDQQVKIRGFRVEPGEIEVVLRQHPALQAAVVAAREATPGAPDLVAYVVPHQAPAPTPNDLRQFLGQQLPSYMLPSAFVALETLPLTPNGKIDRRALPAPDPAGRVREHAYVAPRTPIEAVLADLWADVLGVQPIGVYDNFFAVGGHSLHVVQIMSRLNATFQMTISLGSVFAHPTIAELAEALIARAALPEQFEGIVQTMRDEQTQMWSDNQSVASAALPNGQGHTYLTDTAELSPPGQEPLALLLEEGELTASQAHGIPRLQPAGEPVLSFAQQRLWFLEQIAPDRPLYLIPSALRLTGHLNVSALQHSLNEIVRRHATLRTMFVLRAGQPQPVIAPTLNIAVPVIDLDYLPPDQRASEAHRRLSDLARQPFDLAEGPLLRATVLRLDATDHILLLVVHHIIADGWSFNLLFRELTAFYTSHTVGLAAHAPLPLPDLPIQYTDYAHWQRQQIPGPALEIQLAYWKQQLAGSPDRLQLPTDRPRPLVQTMRAAAHYHTLPPTLIAALTSLSQREGVTLFMILLAAFATLLSRYSEQTDLLIGAPVANRNQRELQHLIGLFVDMLVLRVDLSGNPTFRELLTRVRAMAIGAYSHQDVPFEQVVEALQPERTLSHQPLVQVLFAMQPEPLQAPGLPGLTVTPVPLERGATPFDLAVALDATAEGMAGEWEYATDLFEAETIRRMADNYAVLLEGIVANSERRLADLPLLSAAERQQLLVTWNATHTDYPRERCVQHLFEAQVARTPDAVAVAFADQQLTYGELNRRANQVAQHLRTLGVGPEVLVALCVERSLDMVVGLLGILKAGGAYVPLDPAFPRERLAFMIADAQVSVLLTQQRLGDRHPLDDPGGRPPPTVVYLDADWETLARQADTAPASHVTADNLAYVIYTSGSTGTPKGVEIRHQSVVNFLFAMRQQPGLTDRDVLLAVTTLSFDIAVLELLLPLITGARLVIAPQAIIADGAQLAATLTTAGATVLQATPATWRLLLAAGWPGNPQLTMLCGGEALPWDLAQQLLPKGKSLWNMYGPTETTIWSAVSRVQIEAGMALIGPPIANTQFYVLDRYWQPTPIGVPGELYIGGDGLARGYLNRPDLTAERFIDWRWPLFEVGLENADHPQPPTRLYKTGDLVRYRVDGTLEFLGRNDYQVKVRGFRIELGEIEAALLQHPAVAQSVVLAREDTPGDKRLVAYVVLTPDAQAHSGEDALQTSASTRLSAPPHIRTADLRRFLLQTLPEYMVPSAFVVLEELPVTPNGKVDRQALPAPDTTRPELEQGYVAPRTPIEAALAELWADVLGLERVGINDNFFTLGGHSLQIMQVVARIAAALNYSVAVRDVFLHPTIATLAGRLEQRSSVLQAATPTTRVRDREEEGAPGGQTAAALPATAAMTIEQRPLLALFASKKLAPVDAATLAYLPSRLLERAGVSRDTIIHAWYDNLPVFDELLETHLGRIAIVTLPRFDDQLYQDQESLIEIIIEGLEIAQSLGARVVSLAGLLASATGYGRAVTAALAGRQDLPLLSTGHATTTAAVVLAINRIVAESQRDMAHERVGFLGLGSIGLASLRLMLRCLPHPQEIMLCDVYRKHNALEKIRQELLVDVGFRGTVRVIESSGAVPAELYAATLIIGATNVPGILDITRVNPGTLIVDDSAPHCFNPERAIQRFEARQDILFTEGGMLRSPHTINAVGYLPRPARHSLSNRYAEYFARYNPFEITGCIFSSLLSTRFEVLKPTLGYVDVETCFQHYTLLNQLEFRGADLRCENYVLPVNLIRRFRQRFS